MQFKKKKGNSVQVLLNQSLEKIRAVFKQHVVKHSRTQDTLRRCLGLDVVTAGLRIGNWSRDDVQEADDDSAYKASNTR
jgi:hypothetical protein